MTDGQSSVGQRVDFSRHEGCVLFVRTMAELPTVVPIPRHAWRARLSEIAVPVAVALLTGVFVLLTALVNAVQGHFLCSFDDLYVATHLSDSLVIPQGLAALAALVLALSTTLTGNRRPLRKLLIFAAVAFAAYGFSQVLIHGLCAGAEPLTFGCPLSLQPRGGDHRPPLTQITPQRRFAVLRSFHWRTP